MISRNKDKIPFPIGVCSMCKRVSTVCVQIENDSEAEEFCELHFGAFINNVANDDGPRLRIAFRYHSADLRPIEHEEGFQP